MSSILCKKDGSTQVVIPDLFHSSLMPSVTKDLYRAELDRQRTSENLRHKKELPVACQSVPTANLPGPYIISGVVENAALSMIRGQHSVYAESARNASGHVRTQRNGTAVTRKKRMHNDMLTLSAEALLRTESLSQLSYLLEDLNKPHPPKRLNANDMAGHLPRDSAAEEANEIPHKTLNQASEEHGQRSTLFQPKIQIDGTSYKGQEASDGCYSDEGSTDLSPGPVKHENSNGTSMGSYPCSPWQLADKMGVQQIRSDFSGVPDDTANMLEVDGRSMGEYGFPTEFSHCLPKLPLQEKTPGQSRNPRSYVQNRLCVKFAYNDHNMVEFADYSIEPQPLFSKQLQKELATVSNHSDRFVAHKTTLFEMDGESMNVYSEDRIDPLPEQPAKKTNCHNAIEQGGSWKSCCRSLQYNVRTSDLHSQPKVAAWSYNGRIPIWKKQRVSKYQESGQDVGYERDMMRNTHVWSTLGTIAPVAARMIQESEPCRKEIELFTSKESIDNHKKPGALGNESSGIVPHIKESKMRNKMKRIMDSFAKMNKPTFILNEKLKPLKPYMITGWISDSYLHALMCKTEQVGEMFDNVFDCVGEIRKDVADQCSKQNEVVFTRELVYRVFSLGEMENTGMKFKRLSQRKMGAVKRCVKHHFPSLKQTVWTNVCLFKLKCHMTFVLSKRVRKVQNFWLKDLMEK